MLGVLSRLIFIEQRNHLAHHGVDGFVLIANRSGDRDYPDFVPSQPPQIELLFECLAEEAAVTVYDNDVKGVLSVASPLDHLLKDRSPIVGSRSAGFDELRRGLAPEPAFRRILEDIQNFADGRLGGRPLARRRQRVSKSGAKQP